jgi:hypothetical protein
MSKNVCLVASGINVETATAELAGARQTFDVSLNALRNGMTDAGIKKPPTAEIEAGLDIVIEDWAAVQPIGNQLLAGNTVAAAQLGVMFNRANMMTGNMNSVVQLYSEASKLGL